MLLDKLLDEESKQAIKAEEKDRMAMFHMGLGAGLRYEWGLWQDSVLAQWFKRNGVYHPDDMSGVILRAYWDHLNGNRVSLKQEVTDLRAHYDKRAAQMGGKSRIVRDPESASDIIPPPDPSKASDDN